MVKGNEASSDFGSSDPDVGAVPVCAEHGPRVGRGGLYGGGRTREAGDSHSR